MRQLADLLRKRGLVVLISDMLAPIEKLDKQLGWLGALGHDLVLFHVMDRAEIEFRFEQAAQFEDVESGAEWFVNPTQAREGYLKRFNDHCASVRKSCERHGVEYQWLPTDKPMELALYDFLSVRHARKSGPTRRAAAANA